MCDMNALYSAMTPDQQELVEIIATNIITVDSYQQAYARDKINRSGIEKIVPSDLSVETKMKIISRIEYWLRSNSELKWSTKKGYSRARSSPSFKAKFRDSDLECEWPGCKETTVCKDHRFPYSLGGDASAENSGPLCPWHNLIKMNNPYCIVRWPGEV